MTDNTHGQVPEALRLADALDRAKCIDYYNHVQRDLESAAEVAKLKGQRMVLCSLLGECLPVIEAMLQIPGDDDSDAHLNGLMDRVGDALVAVADERVMGGES